MRITALHFFSFHHGDYKAATAHLSNEEDLAYRRLLDMYYDTEQKIPLDTKWVSRRLRVDEKTLQTVLEDFFIKENDGYSNRRCDEEIVQYHQKAEIARQNGKKGGRRKASHSAQENPAGSDWVPNPNPGVTQGLANHKPITNNHKPITNNQDLINYSSSALSLEAAADFEIKKNKSAFKEKNTDFAPKNDVETFENPLDLNNFLFPKAPNDDFCDLSGKSVTIKRFGETVSEGEWLRDAFLSELPPSNIPTGRGVKRLSVLLADNRVMRNRALAWQEIPFAQRFAAIGLAEAGIKSIKTPLAFAFSVIQARPPDFLEALKLAEEAVSKGDTIVERR